MDLLGDEDGLERMQRFGVWRTLGTTPVLKLLRGLDVRT